MQESPSITNTREILERRLRKIRMSRESEYANTVDDIQDLRKRVAIWAKSLDVETSGVRGTHGTMPVDQRWRTSGNNFPPQEGIRR